MTSTDMSAASFRGGPMIAEDRPCRSCGYNLRGLFIGGNCPECGRTIGGGRRERQSNLIDAPKSWLLALSAGLWLMCGAWLGLLGLLLFAHRWIPSTPADQMIVGCVVGTLWTMGTFIVLRERPADLRPKDIEPSERLRGSWLRISSALTQSMIVPAVVCDYMRVTGGLPLFGYLAMACGAAAILGQIPLCYWLARVCEWSADDVLARRFRNLGWCLAFGAAANLLVAGFAISGIPPLVMVGTYWFVIFQIGMLFAILGVIWSIVEMAWDVRWIFRNAESLETRDETRAARAAEEARRYAEADRLARPAPLTPEAEQLMRSALAPESDRPVTYSPSSLPPPGVRPLNERVIPKGSDGAYGLEKDPGEG